MDFTPKYVDLVRQLTSTAGVGAAVLGAAIPGFDVFSAGLVTGDRFYYSMVSLSNPAQREVGRGTLQVDGSILREALPGHALVNFSAGLKVISLITPAEWHTAVQTDLAGKIDLTAIDTDTGLTANSDTKLASQRAVRTFVLNSVLGLLDFKGSINGSSNPNYPAAVKGDAYIISAAGKIGGAAGAAVDISDVVFATADNAGGTQAAVGASWTILEHNLLGALLAANNLSELASPSTARANLGLGTAAVQPVGTFAVTVADRTALAAFTAGSTAYLQEAGREGMFLWNPANLSTQVAADTAQGIYVALGTDPTGASGAWVRKFSGPINPEWFGVVKGLAAGANAAANTAAYNAMLSTLVVLAVNTNGNYRGLWDILFGIGVYEFNTIDLTLGSQTICGRGSGHAGTIATGATKLKFYGCTGIRLQSSNTSGASTKDGVLHYDAISTAFRDICLEGDFTTAEAEYHGIHARTKFAFRNLFILNFAGDGIRIDADTGALGGNACDWIGEDLYITGCRNGICDIGNNTSAGVLTGGTLNWNRQAGIFASNFLGSVWLGTEMASNGIHPVNDGVSIPASVVSSGGNLYGAIYGQEAGASTNAPSGTTADNTWWYYISAGAPASGKPAWFSGILVRAGGPIIDPSINSRNTYVGCYAEQTGGKAQIYQRSLVIGGMLSQWIWQNPDSVSHGCGVIYGEQASVTVPGTLINVSGTVTTELGLQQGNTAKNSLIMIEPTVAPSGYRFWFRTTNNDLYFAYTATSTFTSVPFEITGPSTTEQAGTGAALPHSLIVPRLLLGDANANARQVGVLAAVPAAGAHGQGEFYFYRGSTAGQLGFACRTAGTPGTWETFWNGYSVGSRIGFTTGAGGTVVQATSKATAVTLNKLSGQITMNGASLAASTIVSFTLNNSQILADDEVRAWIKGGNATPGSYRVQVEGSTAGVRTIVVENRTAGALAEALILGFNVIGASIS